MRAMLRAHRGRFEGAVQRTWARLRTFVDPAEVAALRAAGAVTPELNARIDEVYREFGEGTLLAEWETAIDEGYEYLVDDLVAALVELPDTSVRDAASRKWIRERSARRIVELGDQQREAILATLEYAASGNSMGPRAAARHLRASVGLTGREGRAVGALRARLEADGQAAEAVDRATLNYAKRLHELRAERIARTELAAAFNRGSLEATLGAFPDAAVSAEWATADDERTCSICRPLDGVVVDAGRDFEGGDGPTPPAHPNCRCTLLYEVTE